MIAVMIDQNGCSAGTILADGSIVRSDDEPPVAIPGNWFAAYK